MFECSFLKLVAILALTTKPTNSFSKVTLMDLWHMSELSCLTFGRDRSPLWNSKYATAARLAILWWQTNLVSHNAHSMRLQICTLFFLYNFQAIDNSLSFSHFIIFHMCSVLIVCAFLICQPCVRWAQCVVIGHWWFLLPTTSSCCAFSALTWLGVRKGMVEVGTG